MIVWEMSHNAADGVKEKQTGSGPVGATDRQTDLQAEQTLQLIETISLCFYEKLTYFSDSWRHFHNQTEGKHFLLNAGVSIPSDGH